MNPARTTEQTSRLPLLPFQEVVLARHGKRNTSEFVADICNISPILYYTHSLGQTDHDHSEIELPISHLILPSELGNHVQLLDDLQGIYLARMRGWQP